MFGGGGSLGDEAAEAKATSAIATAKAVAAMAPFPSLLSSPPPSPAIQAFLTRQVDCAPQEEAGAATACCAQPPSVGKKAQ